MTRRARPARPGAARLLLREAGSGTSLAILLTVAAGFCQALAIVGIGLGAQMLEAGPVPWAAGALFAAVLAVLVIVSGLAQLVGQRVVERIATAAAERAGACIAASELATIESLGALHVVDAITRNTAALRRGAHAALGLVFAFAQLAGLLGALVLFNAETMLMLAGVAVAGFFVQDRIRVTSEAVARRAAAADARVALLARHLVNGFRELLGSRKREADLVGRYLLPAATDLSPQRGLARATAWRAGVATWVALTLVFVAAFVAPALGLTAGVALAVFVASHTYDGLQAVVTYLPLISDAGQALRRLEELNHALRPGAPPPAAPRAPPRDFQVISFRGVSFSYAGAEAPTLGPLDLDLRKDEVVFITGGNGSGKSTLMKLLTGLYGPTSGLVLVDGAAWHIEDQRGLFSTVFTDFHVFDSVAGAPAFDRARAEALLDTLHLSAFVRVTDRGFSAARLSAGRRKRLALAQALLEDRPILVLDEWTADQDPDFRTEFFDSVIPALKRRGLTVIAVTHDERFFDRCDRLLRLTDGRIVFDSLPHGLGMPGLPGGAAAPRRVAEAGAGSDRNATA
jgi:putative ATP-binding cassette transporter